MIKNSLIFNSLYYIYNEHKENIENIPTLAIKNMHQQTLRTSLGIGWTFIRDLVYFSSFIIFRFLMAGSGTIEGMNFVLFMMVALIPWNFMNECINGAVGAIKDNKSVLSSMKFPVLILPTVEVMSIFLKRLFTLIIMFFVVLKFGDVRQITLWLFLYYFISMFIFMCIWNLIFSSLVAISNDFEQLYRAGMSIIFFTMPIMWSFEILQGQPWIIRIFKLNPFVYLIEGLRASCYSGVLPDLGYTIYFWGLSIVLLVIGCVLQYKLKNHYIDLI